MTLNLPVSMLPVAHEQASFVWGHLFSGTMYAKKPWRQLKWPLAPRIGMRQHSLGHQKCFHQGALAVAFETASSPFHTTKASRTGRAPRRRTLPPPFPLQSLKTRNHLTCSSKESSTKPQMMGLLNNSGKQHIYTYIYIYAFACAFPLVRAGACACVLFTFEGHLFTSIQRETKRNDHQLSSHPCPATFSRVQVLIMSSSFSLHQRTVTCASFENSPFVA